MAKRKYVKENNLVKAINTDSLELQKPLVNEYYDINVHNSNMDKIDKGYKQNKNDISDIKNELSKTENTSYTTANGIKEFSCKGGYVDNVVIEGETLVNLASTVSSGADRLRVSTLYTPNSNTITFINLSKNKCILSLNKESGWSRDIHLSEGKIAITLNQEFLTVVHARFSDGWTSDDVDTVKKSIVILEGDHTDKPISYFEGLKSVGQGDKIEVLTRGSGKSNLLKTQTITYKDNYMLNYSNGLEGASNNHKYTETYIEIEPNTDYCFYHVSRNICWYDTNKTLINSPLNERTFGVDKDLFYSAKSPNNAKYLRVTIIKNIHNNGETSEIYKGEYDKKQISTTLPSLPNGVKDTIEKRGNKYVKVQRCGEVVLNENLAWFKVGSVSKPNTIQFGIKKDSNVAYKGDSEIYYNCDKFSPTEERNWNDDKEFIFINPNDYIVSILKTKLTAQTLEGFKTWLKSNPITVVYELATPIIEELPNFNPQTFEGDTTLLLNSGVVQGEASFEVTNSLGSELEVLKGKVSDLDDNYVSKYTLTPLNGWGMDNVEFIRDGRHIQINAILNTQGTLSKGTKIATFPYNLRPNITVISDLIDISGNTIGGIEIVNNFIQVNGAFDLKSTPYGCKMSFSYYI